MEERQRIKSLANGEPVLQAEEPLLLEHYHCDSPIVAPQTKGTKRTKDRNVRSCFFFIWATKAPLGHLWGTFRRRFDSVSASELVRPCGKLKDGNREI